MQTYVSLWVKTFGGSVALELQKNIPELQTRTCGARVVDLSGAIKADLGW